jgi:hypothetical protein
MSRSTQQQDALRAKDAAEIKPLLELCRAGRLFEVQAWIAAGKPINSPTNSDVVEECRDAAASLSATLFELARRVSLASFSETRV